MARLKRVILVVLCGRVLSLAGCGHTMFILNPYPAGTPEYHEYQEDMARQMEEQQSQGRTERHTAGFLATPL